MSTPHTTSEIGRRELNRRERLLSIESAGRDLFNAKGFEETTTRELARAAGVGTGTLFLYFPEKRDLLLHLFHRDIVDLNARTFASIPRDAPLPEQLQFVFDRFFDFYERDPRLSRAFLRELFFANPEFRRRHSDEKRVARQITSLVRSAQERGELRREIDAERAAELFLGVYMVGLVAWLVGSIATREGVDRQLRDQLGLCIEGMTTRPWSQ